MITIHNYFDKVSNIQFSTLPEALQKGNEFVTKATSNGKNWNSYQNSEAIKKTIDLYLERLNEHLKNKPAHKTNTPKQQHKVVKPVNWKEGKAYSTSG